MTVTDAELLAYLDATDALRRWPAPVPKWLRQRVLKEGQAVCWHCESAPSERAVYVFSPSLGGDGSSANVVPACSRCAVRFRDLDPMSEAWAKGVSLSPTKAGRRLEALAACQQHDVPMTAKRSQALAQAWLASHRWSVGPRVAVSAMEVEDGWLVGPVAVNPGDAWTALAMQIRQAGGRRVPHAPRVLEVPGDAWPGAVGQLVDNGGLVWRLTAGRAQPSLAQAPIAGGRRSRSNEQAVLRQHPEVHAATQSAHDVGN